ncbi:hypothetical protein Dimus_016414 [Dionaea muscipula]
MECALRCLHVGLSYSYTFLSSLDLQHGPSLEMVLALDCQKIRVIKLMFLALGHQKSRKINNIHVTLLDLNSSEISSETMEEVFHVAYQIKNQYLISCSGILSELL